MSKLIVNTGTLSAGGAERVLSILSKPFADAFDEVQYVMWLDAKYPDIFYSIDSRVKIVRISKDSHSNQIWKQMLWFRKYVKREKPDLVLSFMVMVCFTVTVSLAFTGIKQVVAERNDPRHCDRKWLRHIINCSYLFPDVKGIIMQTEWNREYFINRVLYKKTEVIYNPVALSDDMVGSAITLPKENVVVSVGRLTAQKNYTALLRSFSLFCKSHEDYKLIIYGEGKLRSELTNLSNKLQISDRVYLPGRRKDVLDLIGSARMFVMSSEYEGMSNALIESMCIGLPCISTKVSGATDLIKDGVNGYLVDIGDEETMAKRMGQLADDNRLCTVMGTEAAKVYSVLSDDVVSNKWLGYLSSIIIQES